MRSASSAERKACCPAQELFFSRPVPKKLPFPIARFRESVRIENKNVSLGKLDAPLLIGGIVKDADRESSELELFDVAILPEQGFASAPHWRREAGWRPFCQVAKQMVMYRPSTRRSLTSWFQLAKKFRRLKFVRREAPKNTGGNGSVERRGAALAADVPERDAQLLRARRKGKSYKVAANFPRGENPCGVMSRPKSMVGTGTQQRVFAGAARL